MDLQALAEADTAPPTIFDKIIAKQIPSTVVYEDDLCLVFKDISPQAPTHMLCIPKVRAGLTQISKATEAHASLLGHLMVQAGRIGAQHCPKGFRLVINDGDNGAQTVYHLHIHILGGRQMSWPPG
jgi:histidine triad (HIT) family protein